MTTTGFPAVWLIIIGLVMTFGIAVFVLVVIALMRSSRGQNRSVPPRIGGLGVVPPMLDDSFTNPANPMYHVHHGSAAAMDAPPPPSVESTPAPTPAPAPSPEPAPVAESPAPSVASG